MVYNITSGCELRTVSIHNQAGFQISAKYPADPSKEPQTYPALFAHRNKYVHRHHLEVSVLSLQIFYPYFSFDFLKSIILTVLFVKYINYFLLYDGY